MCKPVHILSWLSWVELAFFSFETNQNSLDIPFQIFHWGYSYTDFYNGAISMTLSFPTTKSENFGGYNSKTQNEL